MWRINFPKSLKSKTKMRENLSLHSSFKVGGYVDIWFEPTGLSELYQGLMFSQQEKVPFYLVGAGSNIIFPDEGVRGVVGKLTGEFKSMRFDMDSCFAGGGVSIPKLLRECLMHGMGGCEFLAGIPGTIGGALVMNAGAAGGAIGDIVEEVICLDPNEGVVRIKKEDIKFSYRKSSLDGNVILFCKLNLKRKNRPAIMQAVYDNLSKRKKAQDSSVPNAGCAFKNPVNFPESAGRLIDSLGLKGYRVGGAMISKKHANFILNVGMARSSDVVHLMRFVQKRVLDERGVKLEPEIRFVGSFHEEVLLNGK